MHLNSYAIKLVVWPVNLKVNSLGQPHLGKWDFPSLFPHSQIRIPCS